VVCLGLQISSIVLKLCVVDHLLVWGLDDWCSRPTPVACLDAPHADQRSLSSCLDAAQVGVDGEELGDFDEEEGDEDQEEEEEDDQEE